jgi:Predicted membrane protein
MDEETITTVTTESSAAVQLPRARIALPWVTTVARLVVAGVLIVAGWLKMGAPALSIKAVEAYELLPTAVAEIVGYVLPILEIVIGLLLVVGLLTRLAAVVAALLMLAFVIGIASAWARGLNIDCGCFGGGGELPPGQRANYLPEILRDLGLLALAAWVAIKPPGRLALDAALGLTPVTDEDQSPYRDELDADDDPEADEEPNREKDD